MSLKTLLVSLIIGFLFVLLGLGMLIEREFYGAWGIGPSFK